MLEELVRVLDTVYERKIGMTNEVTKCVIIFILSVYPNVS